MRSNDKEETPQPQANPESTTNILLAHQRAEQELIQAKEALDKRTAELAHLAAVVESSDDAIVTKTLEGIITTWNKGAERIFGYTSEEVVGKHITILIPPDRIDEEPAIIEKLRRGQRIDHYETIRMRKDGARIFVSLTVSPVKDSSGKIVGASKIARDITDRIQTAEERDHLLEAERAARAEAERVSLVKDEFLATLSHELRTPLNAILGWSQILRNRRRDDPELLEGLSVIERNARVQTQLIEDLLDMSRIISGKLRLDIQQVDVSDVLKTAVASVRHSAESKDIRLQSMVDTTAGLVRGDPNRLQQCFWNLLSNAIKFTPKGGWIKASLQRTGNQI
ncbi:MAG: PAS domain-containing sensor histidine kinase, partial [Polyangiaceae bacterium]|nr:PAS domain-containing sensor histidine kinase [Polyangiaceae bacterium]